MNRKHFLIVGLLAAFGLTGAAQAIENPVIDFGSGFAKENGRLVDDHTSTAGDTLCIVGHVVDFKDPLDDLDPNDPTREYTYVYSGLVSQGTVVAGGGSTVFYDTDYAGGTLRVYCDVAQNADFADKATFADGDMILEASLSNFHIQTKSFNCSGSQNAELVFTGGSLFNRVSDNGNGFNGIITGLFSVCEPFVDDPREAEGYFGLSDTKVDVEPPTPVEDATWGGIKQLFDER